MSGLRSSLSVILSAEIDDIIPVSGGDISSAYKATVGQDSFFIKVNKPDLAPMFEVESFALNYLKGKSSLLVPDVVAAGRSPNQAYLVLKFIKPTLPDQSFWENFGQGLAQLHSNSKKYFGFSTPNYIGPIVQENRETEDWSTFYDQYRCRPLIRKGIDLKCFDQSDLRRFENLVKKLPDIFPEEIPALCHGDLWSGNYLCSHHGPYIIDPSVAYLHREMDLAMTKLFGGFDQSFYSSYFNTFPIEPGFNERLTFYQLFYLLVHAVLFGGGYIHSVKSILNQF